MPVNDNGYTSNLRALKFARDLMAIALREHTSTPMQALALHQVARSIEVKTRKLCAKVRKSPTITKSSKVRQSPVK
jgi:hypothetical protein